MSNIVFCGKVVTFMKNEIKEKTYGRILDELNIKLKEHEAKLLNLNDEFEYANMIEDYLECLVIGYHLEHRNTDDINKDKEVITSDIEKIKASIQYWEVNKFSITEGK